MQVTIDFHPIVNGEMKDELIISYDTGLYKEEKNIKIFDFFFV